MELEVRPQLPPANKNRSSLSISSTTTSSSLTKTHTKPFFALRPKKDVIPKVMDNPIPTHRRKVSTESSSNGGNQSMNASISLRSPTSSHLPSPLTVSSSPNAEPHISDIEALDINDSDNNNVVVNSHDVHSNHSHTILNRDDPLFVSDDVIPVDQELNHVNWASRKFHSTTAVNDRRHTEPTKSNLLQRSNSLKPKLIARHSTFPLPRNSLEFIHLIDNDHNPIASEAERLRNSIISKRELKKKRKEFLEDEKVLVGNKVSEGHSNYVMAYNMLTGIRVSVSRVSGVRKPLVDLDFILTKKLAFDVSGSELTPSSKYDFKFKDYAPEVFRELRLNFGLDPADYLVSLTSKYILSELGSPGKSGSFFYYSRDYRFIIKTIHHSEHKQLRRVLKDYYNYVKKNPNTLISQFYGLHRLKMKVNGRPRKVHFIVMNNLFPANTIDRQYDLKGSTDGRYTRKNNNNNNNSAKKTVVYKDLNWLEDGYGLKLKNPDKQKLVNQLRKDVKLLQDFNIMDYSMLIGVHVCHKKHDENRRLTVLEGPDSITFTIPKQDFNALLDNEFSNSEFYQCLKSDDDDYIYYIGVIDCLTRYSTMKRLETLMRRVSQSKNFSCINAKDYGDRFMNFMESHVFKKDKID